MRNNNKGTWVAILASATLLSAMNSLAASKSPAISLERSTLPPIGYVKFCALNPSDCQSQGSTDPVQLTPEKWRALREVNALVNTKIRPLSDLELYGEPEVWALPVFAGDCEDYLLLKKKYLEGVGFPSSSLLITVVLDERQEGHAVLTVASSDGDYILDNRRNDIVRPPATGYAFIKRQSRENPRKWVGLVKQAETRKVETSASPTP